MNKCTCLEYEDLPSQQSRYLGHVMLEHSGVVSISQGDSQIGGASARNMPSALIERIPVQYLRRKPFSLKGCIASQPIQIQRVATAPSVAPI
jgi:hypothetical protein